MSEAEIRQYFLRGNIPDKEQYLQICIGKTSGLFSAALQSSAVLFNLDETIAIRIGELFGIFYQIKNDLAPDSAKYDLQNKIYTAKDIYGIENAIILSDNYKVKLKMLVENFSNDTYKKELQRLFEIL